jgi:thiol-disulfide isomerase/thioredoxin
MKKLVFVPLLTLLALATFAQTDSTSIPPYKRFPTVPPFKILLVDSTTWLTKENMPRKKATMVILFSPDCDHCKHETEQLISEIDKFKKIEIVMATPLPFDKMKEFYGLYDLGRFKNIHVGRDVNFILPVFFAARSLPYLAFYDKKGNLIDAFEGSLPIEQVLEKFKE